MSDAADPSIHDAVRERYGSAARAQMQVLDAPASGCASKPA